MYLLSVQDTQICYYQILSYVSNTVWLTASLSDKIGSQKSKGLEKPFINKIGSPFVPMWFIRVGNEICIPTSRHIRKYKKQKSEARPYASVMIDISRAGIERSID